MSVGEPQLSVIMPVFNAANYVRQAIDSILSQTFTDFEFLIIDDGSQDATVEIVQSYEDERIQLFQNEENLGSLLSRNKLMDTASGKYLAFQDGDDFSNPDRLEQQHRFLEHNPEIVLCGTGYRAINEQGAVLKEVYMPTDYRQIQQGFKRRCPVLFPSSMVRKEVHRQLGGFREYFKDKGNYDFDWMCLIAEQYQVDNLSSIHYNRRILPTSNSKEIANADKIFGDQTVHFLRKQRETDGKDALMGYKLEEFNEFIDKKRSFIHDNPQFYFQWQMDTFMSYGMRKDAFINALRAIQAKPTLLKSYRDAFYILRKMLVAKDYER
jgi:glycosyltransferase involved in cell wall biosynthesis